MSIVQRHSLGPRYLEASTAKSTLFAPLHVIGGITDTRCRLHLTSLQSRCICRAATSDENVESNGRSSGEGSQERFIDIAEVLRDAREDGVYEALEDDDEASDWAHEDRFAIEPSEVKPAEKIKGALDPDQADILSAYSKEQGFREVDVHYAAYHMQDSPDMEIIDVRSPVEYQTGHIAGSRNISLDDLSQAVKEGSISHKKPLAVICARGGRSAQACVRLSKVFGFENVTNIAGGMNAWIGAGFPIMQ